MNVARVVRHLGSEVTAVYPVGGVVGQLLQALVDAEGVDSVAVPVRGETREDVTVSDETTGEQYRLVFPGPHLYADEWANCLAALAELGGRPDFVCASGSLPPGAPEDCYARVAAIVRGAGARLVLDTSGAALRSALQEHVYLLKPNLDEMRGLTGENLEDQASMIAACRHLIERGQAEVIALTLGAQGALLVTGERAWRAPPIAIQPISTVGAGDSFLGGMVWALASNMPIEQSFRHAVAAASAALLVEGTALCRGQDVSRLMGQVIIEDVDGHRA